ncbi:MAG: Hpt domain-containing protein [Desulfatibacillaceae bacterium]
MGEQVINMQALADMLDHDRDAMRHVLAEHMDQAGELMERLRTALASGDSSGVERAAHTLKGASGTVYAYRAERAARDMEDAAADGDMESARGLMPELEAAMDQVSRFVKDGFR